MGTRFNRAAEPSFYNSSFQYTTVSSMREDTGITVSELSDLAALKLIRRVSNSINGFTKNWFEPVKLARAFSGRGQQELDLLGVPQALEINAVKVANQRTRYNVVSDIDSAIYETDVTLSQCGSFLVHNTKCFPAGNSNVFVEGWFGRVEDQKHLEFYVSSGALASGATSLVLNAVSGTNVYSYGTETFDYLNVSFGYSNVLAPRNIMIFVNSSGREIFRLKANTVNYSTGSIGFDPIVAEPIQTISSGTKVLVLGSVPELIEEATNIIVKDTYDNSDVESLGLKSEKTTDYQYVRATAFETGQPTLAEISSNSRVNRILMEFDNQGYVSL